MADPPKPAEPLDIAALIATADTVAADLSARLIRGADVDKRMAALIVEGQRTATESSDLYSRLLTAYRAVAKYAGEQPRVIDQLREQLREKDRRITLRDTEITGTRKDLANSRLDTNKARDEVVSLKTTLADRVRENVTLKDHLKNAGRVGPEKGQNPTEAYVKWVKERYKPLYALEAPNFVAYDKGKLLDAGARFLLYSHAGINVILDGPTGSGKSTLMEWAAFNERLPMHLIPPVKDLSMREVNGDYAQDMTLSPGPVPLFLIFGGYLGIDEAPNLNPKVAVALHSLLQGKPYRFETHFGPVDIDPERGRHKITGAGNFAYQRPNFNPATLQRCNFMDLPSIGKEELGRILSGQGGSTTPFGDYAALLRDTHPWFFQNGHVASEGGDYLWVPRVRNGNQVATGLSQMMLDVRETVLKAGKELYGEELDLSPATMKRAIALYSPKLNAQAMRDIVSECLVNPVAVMYPDHREEKTKLTERVYQSMNPHLQRLGMR